MEREDNNSKRKRVRELGPDQPPPYIRNFFNTSSPLSLCLIKRNDISNTWVSERSIDLPICRFLTGNVIGRSLARFYLLPYHFTIVIAI